MKGKRFTTIEEIKTKSLEELNDLPSSAFQKCSEDRNNGGIDKCIIFDGDYFEGGYILLKLMINWGEPGAGPTQTNGMFTALL